MRFDCLKKSKNEYYYVLIRLSIKLLLNVRVIIFVHFKMQARSNYNN